jgi:hypothetical protein
MKGFFSIVKNLLILISVLLAGSAHAASIDFNSFYLSPTVSVSADGSTATLKEDSFLPLSNLINDPSFGDPQVLFPVIGSVLSFTYNFEEGATSRDEFSFSILDELGASLGSSYEFFSTQTSSGMVSFDVSSLAGRVLGLNFQLASLLGDFDLGSVVTVSNLRVSSLSAVPIPAALWLVLPFFIIFTLKRRF